MLDSVKIARRQSEIRQALATLVGKDAPNDEETRSMEALDAEYRTNETRYRAALTAEDSERREAGEELETRSDREWGELVGRFELRQIAFALDEGKALTGATKEVVEELRSRGGYQGIPVPYAALEQRAGETIAADQVNPKTIRPTIDRIFPSGVAAQIGIERIQIERGELAFPVATSGAVFGWQTDELANVGGAHPYKTTERSLTPDDALIAGTAVSQWDRLTKQIGTPAISNLIPDATAIMTATVQGIAPGYLGVYGGVDLIRDPYTKAASGALVLTGLVTADFTVPRGMQIRLRWSDYLGHAVTLKQGKTKARVTIHLSQALARMLDGMQRVGPYVLTRADGRPWFSDKDHKALSKDWSAHMVACGLRPSNYGELTKAQKAEHLRFNDLRGTAITMLAEAGNGVPQICAVTGHTLQSATRILEKYLAMTPALSKAAILAFENSPATQFANRLQTGPQPAQAGVQIKEGNQ